MRPHRWRSQGWRQEAVDKRSEGSRKGHLMTSGYRGGLGTYIWDPHQYAAHSVTNTLLHYHSLDLLATNGGIDQYNFLNVICLNNTFNDFTFNCFDGFSSCDTRSLPRTTTSARTQDRVLSVDVLSRVV